MQALRAASAARLASWPSRELLPILAIKCNADSSGVSPAFRPPSAMLPISEDESVWSINCQDGEFCHRSDKCGGCHHTIFVCHHFCESVFTQVQFYNPSESVVS